MVRDDACQERAAIDNGLSMANRRTMRSEARRPLGNGDENPTLSATKYIQVIEIITVN